MTTEKAASPTLLCLDVKIVKKELVIETIAALMKKGGGSICFATVHMTMEAYDDASYRAVVNSADLVVPDGMPLVWMQRRLGHPEAARVRANDLMMAALSWAAENGFSVGFYGSSDAVLKAITTRAARDFPRLSIVYAYSPPYRPVTVDEDREIVQRINSSDPDILFVGLGCPKQEIWMSNHRPELSSVLLGVGASFDFYAGTVPESPEWLGRLGLEWMYRLVKEPRRLWRRYLSTNPRFIFLALLQLWKGRKRA